MAENSRGYHHPGQRNFEQGGSGQGAMMPEAKGRAGKSEPTNHAGHTHEMARRTESDRRIEAVKAAHGAGRAEHDYHAGHERVLHETHSLHQHGDNGPSQSKHGAAHHFRDGEKGNGE